MTYVKILKEQNSFKTDNPNATLHLSLSPTKP